MTSEVEMERGGWGARRFFVDGVFGSLVGGEGNSASQKHNFFVYGLSLVGGGVARLATKLLLLKWGQSFG